MLRLDRSKGMKIAILVLLFPPKWLAGVEIATYNIARHLAMRGHEVHVITSLDEGLPQESMQHGFYVHRIGRRKIRFVGIIFFWLKIWLVLKKIKPDVVHSQDIAMGIPGFLMKKLLKKPYLVWRRGGDVYLSGLLMRVLAKLVLKNANVVIALTKDMKRKVQQICNREVLVIPNGIDFERFGNFSRDEVRCKLQIKAEERIGIFVGRFRLEKGVRYLIEAMGIIRQKNQSVRLILIGEGPEEENLRRMVKQLNLETYINFAGQIPNENVPQYMAAADFFVLPSVFEGFPNVILEAMASGLPIVATRVNGLSEIIRDGENGFLVEPKNSEKIAEKVLLLLEDDQLRERISRNNKERVRDYSWESVIQRVEEVYKKLLVNL